jgi:glycosyltransferase involved in cell wall biosynthesis
MRVLACHSPYGQGGIGQHFAHLVEETRSDRSLAYYCNAAPHSADGPSLGRRVTAAPFGWLHRWTPLRYSAAWASHLKNECFDRRVAARLDAPHERFMGFVGQSLRSFRRARTLGFDTLELVAVNSHVDNVRRLHDRARRDWGVDGSWLNDAQRRKTLDEYAAADRIYVHSEYTRQSFLEAGIPASKLERTYLRPDPRFRPPDERPDDGIFRVVYVGRVDVTKGLPVLLDAFASLPHPAELTIVGGWPTRRMRRFLQPRIERDARIRMESGDPLSVLQRADVFVHPSYEDGFGYAPMEAMACGVPVLVTADTGMKEYVTEGVDGYILPTGDTAALGERLHHLYRHPLRPVPTRSTT